MGSWPIGFGSGYGAQDLGIFGPFAVVKLILVLVVLPLLMYACRQKLAKDGPRDAGPKNYRARETCVLEKPSIASTAVKKRRRRKKKLGMRNVEGNEQWTDENPANEHTDAASTGEVAMKIRNRDVRVSDIGENADTANAVKQGKDVRNKNQGTAAKACTTNTVNEIREIKKRKNVRNSGDVDCVTSRHDAANSEISEPGGRVAEDKDVNRGNNCVTSRRSTQVDDNSGASLNVKEVTNRGDCSKNLIRNTVCSVLDQDIVCRDKKQQSPRNVHRADEVPAEALARSDSCNSVYSKKSCETTARQTPLVPKSNKGQSVKARKEKEANCRAEDSNFSSDTAERQRNDTNHDSKTNKRRNCTAPRRRSFDRSDNDPRGNNFPENRQHCPNVNKTRRKSFNRTSEKDPRETELPKNRQHCPTVNGTRRRSFDRASEKDTRETELSANCKHSSTVNGTRRRSFDRASEKDTRETELPENRQHSPTVNGTRRRSFDRASEDTRETELSENRKHCPTVNGTRRRSFERSSENATREKEPSANYWCNHADNRARRTSFSCNSESDPKRYDLPENHRHCTGSRTRRRSFHRSSESDPRVSDNPETHERRTGNQRGRACLDHSSETTPDGSKRPENQRQCPSDKQTSFESEKHDEYEDGNSAEASPVVGTTFETTSTSAEKAGTKNSTQTVKEMEAAGNRQEAQSQFFIDPEVRERIANPKYPVRVPEKPFIHLSYQDGSQRYDDNIGPNKSFVGGLFGRKWRKEMERKEAQRDLEEAAEELSRDGDFMDLSDNICPTFMIWGVCHRGADRCPLRHPSYRYLERPSREVPSPERAPEQPKRDPNSYAAILEKKQTVEPEEFVNEAVFYEAGTTLEVCERSYSKALVNERKEKDTSIKSTYEEAWPSLGSPVHGQNIKVSKAWQPRRAWTTQKGPQIFKETSPATEDKIQIANDEIIADELQADEYGQISEFDELINEFDDYSHYPEEEVNDDSFDHQEQEDMNTQNEHLETKVRELEQFDSSHSSPVIIEQSSRGVGDPTPPPVVSSLCDICMDRPKDATLVCGHRFCYVCALQMRLDERVCAICRRCIVSVIKTYN